MLLRTENYSALIAVALVYRINKFFNLPAFVDWTSSYWNVFFILFVNIKALSNTYLLLCLLMLFQLDIYLFVRVISTKNWYYLFMLIELIKKYYSLKTKAEILIYCFVSDSIVTEFWKHQNFFNIYFLINFYKLRSEFLYKRERGRSWERMVFDHSFGLMWIWHKRFSQMT